MSLTEGFLIEAWSKGKPQPKNPKPMKHISLFIIPFFVLAFGIMACDNNSGSTSTATLHQAFDTFDKTNFTITLSGDKVTLKSNGRPNHTSPYWSNTTTRSIDGITTKGASSNHALFVPPLNNDYSKMAPGNIDSFNGSFSLTVPASPQKASSSTATGLGPIGMAVSGAMIYNDEEGPSIPLSNAAPSLDYSGAHTGPQSYHYHLEPKAWTNDDDKLVGIISDGFFVYGRKCYATGTYPTDLDASGGHTSKTKYSSSGEYHYHIQNSLYLNQYYIIFPGNYQGTPNAIQ